MLKIISQSTFDLPTVLNTLVDSAGRLCQAENVQVFLRDEEVYRLVASNGFSPEYQEYVRQHPVAVGRGTLVARTALVLGPVHIPDVLADSEYTYREGQKLAGYRAMLGVPLVRERSCIGVMALTRQAPQPFTPRQIELATTFAAQAVIAVENTRLLNELRESLDRQTATSEVLSVISSSRGDLAPVFDAILENATRICEATFGSMLLREGDTFRRAALHNTPKQFEEFIESAPIFKRGMAPTVDRAVDTGQVSHTSDAALEQPNAPIVRYAGARTLLDVPMLKGKEAIGVLGIYRKEVRPFTEKQIALVQNFAAQAVIAIENARLLNELRESLQQQTATSEVLQVISSTPGELEPVFNAMLENATRICEAKLGNLFLREGNCLRAVAVHGESDYADRYRREPVVDVSQNPGTPLDRVIKRKQVIHISDLRLDQSYLDGNRYIVALADTAGARTELVVPMLKEDEIVGAIVIYRQVVRPFTDKQIALVQNFAAQAVIAIENTRLLNELRQRTTDLTESLEQQTATSEVLRVISSSQGELNPVFDAMLENGVRLCEAKFGVLFLYDGKEYRTASLHSASRAYAEVRQRNIVVRHTHPDVPLTRLTRTKELIHIADVRTERCYIEGDPTFSELVDVAGARTLLVVPMLKENELVGAIAIYRQEVRSFADKQIKLVQNFAAQAVIAIENTRLLNELRQSLEQQTATADVLRVISSSPGELEAVFTAMLESATRICEAKFAALWGYADGMFRMLSSRNVPAELVEFGRQTRVWGPDTALGRLAHNKQAIHVVDALADSASANSDVGRRMSVKFGVRTLLAVPMINDGELIGAVNIYRSEVRPFTDKQIALVQNFAAQAVIAIENARLLSELRESLEQQTATSEVLGVISRSPGDLQPVFDNMLRNAVRICEAKFGLLVRFDGKAFHMAAEVDLPPELAEFEKRRGPFLPPAGALLDRVMKTKRMNYTPDMVADAVPGAPARLGDARSAVSVPMLKDDKLIGAMFIYRQEVRPFTNKQIGLLQNFAAQAVIAIENTRLLNELRESLEQQTATAEVLRVISSSPTNVQPVFDSIAESAVRLCDGQFSFVVRFDGKVMDFASYFGLSAEGLDAFRSMMPMPASEDTASGRAILRRAIVEVPDVTADSAYGPQAHGLARAATYRSIVAVPLLHEGNPIGVISVARANAGSFPERQITLLQAFADQAVIAIRNVRLFDEVQARTEELSESLQHQTATADVLKVISRSTFDLRVVLQTLVESAARFCAADKAQIIREKDGGFYTAEAYGYSREFMDYIKNIPIKAERGAASGRALAEGRVIHIIDVKADPEYTLVEAQKLGDYRTALGVPMLREGIPIGVLTLTRSEVQPFTEKQIELVTTFADQAAIAIENVRLFDEIQDKSRQLEEASQHKSQILANMSHELRTPLNAILGYTELMADGAYGEPSEEMLGVLKRLEANGRHLLGLINDVLDLSKIEAGQLMLELSDYSIEDIAQTVRSTLEPLATDKKLAFKLDLAQKLPTGRGDGRRLTQVLINLVGNAIKFTDAGEVAIDAQANNGAFLVSVRDTGPGISAGDQAKLFQEFQQADNAITKKKGGTGLGLAISKRIIEMHGGRIWVESQPGQGSRFAFMVPIIVEQQAGTS